MSDDPADTPIPESLPELYSLGEAAKQCRCSKRLFASLADPCAVLVTPAVYPVRLYCARDIAIVKDLVLESSAELQRDEQLKVNSYKGAILDEELRRFNEGLREGWLAMRALDWRKQMAEDDARTAKA
jgi:hypothetical protein